MKRFLAVYTGSPNGFEKWQALDEAERKKREAAGIQAWGAWQAAQQSVIVDQGGPLSRTKRTSSTGIADVRNNLAGYVILQAESHEGAAKLFEKHPHFTIFPGDAVETMEILPIPGQ